MSKSTQVAAVTIGREQYQGHNGHGWTTEHQTVVRDGKSEATFSRLPRGGFTLSVIDRNTEFAANHQYTLRWARYNKAGRRTACGKDRICQPSETELPQLDALAFELVSAGL